MSGRYHSRPNTRDACDICGMETLRQQRKKEKKELLQIEATFKGDPRAGKQPRASWDGQTYLGRPAGGDLVSQPESMLGV